MDRMPDYIPGRQGKQVGGRPKGALRTKVTGQANDRNHQSG